MKSLIIVRHAKAVWNESSGDFERNLDPQGVIDAGKLGQLLYQEGIVPDRVLCSSALRAFRTASIIVEHLKLGDGKLVKEDRMYNATSETLMDIAQGLGREKVVMMVGHNPGVSDFVSLMTDGSQVNMGTCDAAILGFDIEDWEGCVAGSGYLSRYIENY